MHKPSAPPPYGFIRGKEEHLKLRRRMRLLSVISCFISQVWHLTIPNAEDVDSVVKRETSDCFYLLTPAAYCSILLPLSRSQLNLHFHSAKQSIISSYCCVLTLSLSWPWTELLSHIACWNIPLQHPRLTINHLSGECEMAHTSARAVSLTLCLSFSLLA